MCSTSSLYGLQYLFRLQMIACDGESCEREWVSLCFFSGGSSFTIFQKFHLGCVGLTEIPEGEWYCEDCRIDEL